MEVTATRIYVGGLGERVTENNLRQTFSSLGSVQSVDIIRTKGRSFAYINFLPASQNSLPKLFSMYNGCLWKGGKLKLEKAKEHYVDRLKREWAEDAALENEKPMTDVGDNENMVSQVETKSNLDLEKGQIRIFFPKLRKIKSLPLRGTGKHKYSFQRVPVPSLPVHMCDCCLENSDPVKTPRQKFTNDAAIQDQGINEEEINVMNSVMNKLLNRETRSSSEQLFRLPRENKVQDSEVQDSGGMNEKEINLMDSVMKRVFDRRSSSRAEHNKGSQDHSQESGLITNLPVDGEMDADGTDDDDDIEINLATGQDDGGFFESWGFQTKFPGDNEVDDGTDDDDIKINLGTGQNDVAFSKSWGFQTNLVEETTRSNEQLAPVDSLAIARERGKPEKKAKFSNKRRSVSDEGLASSPRPKKKARLQTQPDKPEDEHLQNPNSVTKPESKRSEEPVENLDCVTKPETKRSSTTNDTRPQKTALKEPVGDGTSSLFSGSHNKEKKPKDEGGPNWPSSGADNKPTRRSSWVQKSSWTQLVGGQSSTTSSSFSISQILPINTVLEKQDSHKPVSFSTTTATTTKEPRTSTTASGGSNPSSEKNKVRTSRDDAGPSETIGTKPRSVPKPKPKPKQVSSSLPIIALGVRLSSETCPFMRSADSSSKEHTPFAAKSDTVEKGDRN